MISDENIAQLLEMGFTQEKAKDALTQSNNNVEQALAYLFNDAPVALAADLESLAGPMPQEAENPRNPFVDNIRTQVEQTDSSMSDFQTSSKNDNIINSLEEGNIRLDGTQQQFNRESPTNLDSDSAENDAPVLPQRPSQASSDSKNIGGFMDDDLRKTLSAYVDRDMSPTSDISPFSDYDVFEDKSKYLRPEYLPPVLVPGMRNLLEAYFAPLLMILHEVTSFRNTLLEHDFIDYGYNKSWFKGERISVKDTVPSRLILETQRLLAFVDGDSERFFASIRNLTDSFPKSMLEELQRVESVDELMNCVYNSYVEELKKTNNLVSNEIDTLFHCKFNTADQSEVNAACFSIEFDLIRGNMYQSLHNIIIGENMEKANAIDISRFSDVITIPILAPEDMYNVSSSQGISVPENFYPQIYSKESSSVYKEIVSQLTDLVNRRQTVTKQKQSLTSFRGQKIGDALKVSLEALNSEIDDLSIKIEVGESDATEKLAQLSAAASDLEQFCQSFQEKGDLLRKEWFQINNEIESFDLTTEINSRMSEVKDVYRLIGAIFDESNFFYLTKDRDPAADSADQWIKVQYSNKNFHLGNSSFNEVEQSIFSVTSNLSDFSNAIVLIYCKSDCWNNTEANTPVPNGLKKFLTEDKANLHEILRYSEEEQLGSASNEEEDELDEYIENVSVDNEEGTHRLPDDEENLLEMDSPQLGNE